jgi:hypothetical protein
LVDGVIVGQVTGDRIFQFIGPVFQAAVWPHTVEFVESRLSEGRKKWQQSGSGSPGDSTE